MSHAHTHASGGDAAPRGGTPASATFGLHTFGLEAMQKRLPRPIFEAIQATIRSGEPLDQGVADVVAGAMKDWAVEHGATHFTHWFQPLTGATAEKHDAFLSLTPGATIESFTGSQLIQAEPDASSFPSGGMRSTFEARGYTAWDPTSPAFLVFHERGATLTIPSVFLSWTGEALDKKTPLLRSMRELSNAAVRTLRLLGRTVRRVVPTLGAEQEYFVVRRDYYDGRPDLQVTGRTLLGAMPPKGQQLEDHYFGAIDERALDFMAEVEAEAWKLGIPLKTRHNEVAPHQYEAAPIYQQVNVAADHNQMLMQLLRKVAHRRGLAALLHEKPFAGVNGSGKHNNWSMADDTGRNLLEPGDDPDRNTEFLFFLCAVIRAVHRRSRLLRCAVAHAANDHRLGANEAPPAIISVYLGERLSHVLDTLLEGKSVAAVTERVIRTGIEVLPEVRKDNTDRNRTSPFAFTGNKFEFRAVGSGQSVSLPMTYLNVAVAEALVELGDALAKRLDAGEDRVQATLAVAREAYAASKAIVFNGNNYDPEWVKEAARRGLPNDVNTPAALAVLEEAETAGLFEKFGIFRAHELKARHTIALEHYDRILHIEAQQMLRMVKTGVLPAAWKQQEQIGRSIAAAVQAGLSADAQRKELGVYNGRLESTIHAMDAVREALHDAHELPPGPKAEAFYLAERLVPAMARLREACDALERRTDLSLWPFPTYHQLLFQ
jgi:glutamine synthetase